MAGVMGVARRRSRIRTVPQRQQQTVQPRDAFACPAAEEVAALFEDVTSMQVLTFASGEGGSILKLSGIIAGGVGADVDFGSHDGRMITADVLEVAKQLCGAHHLVQEPRVEERVSSFGEPYEVYRFSKAGKSLF